MKVLRLLLISALLLLSGCGFHLRGNIDLPADLKTMHVQGASKYSDFGVELRRNLRSNGVEVVDSASAAKVVLKISNSVYNRRLLTASGATGKVAEYELLYTLIVSLHDRKGTQLLAPQRLRQLRDYTFDRDSVLGKSNEEASLRKDMERDMARQVLNRLQAYRRG